MPIRNPKSEIRNPTPRLLIIGLDGGTWSALGPLCDYGEMPNLARLRNQGAWSDLLSTQPPFTAPAWSSIVTGVNPGKHGVLDFLHKAQDPARSLRNEGTPVNSTHVQAPTVWAYLNAAKRQVGSMNFPLSYPLQPLDDFAISGMLTPPNAKDWTYPPELAAELDGYIVELDYGRPGKELRRTDLPLPGQMLADITKMTERRGFNALKLMQSRNWDVFAVVFTGTDRIYHHFWHYLQPGNPEEARKLDVVLAEQLQRYFQLLDSIIGSMVRSAGSDANTIMISDHGFGPAARNWVHLNNWLLELDMLVLKTVSNGGWMQRIKRSAPWLSDIAKRILPQEARQSLQRFGSLADAIDWPHTLAWVEPLYNNVAGIYLNRSDLYPGGPVKPAAANHLCEAIIDQAQYLRLPGTNHPLIPDIRKSRDLYHGPHLDRFPDLIITLDPDHAVVPTLGTTLITPVPQLLRTGDHRPEGIFLAHGPNIQPGHLSETPHLIDVAPTVLHLAGASIPPSMDGHVIAEAFVPGYLAQRPPRRGQDLPQPKPPGALTDKESDAVANRLRGLGYLD